MLSCPASFNSVLIEDDQIFILEGSSPSTLVCPGTIEQTLLQMPKSDGKELKTSFHCAVACVSACFVEVQTLIYGAFLVSAWQLNTSPSAKQMGAVLERGGGPGPNCRDGHSLTAAFILLLFLLHTQGFLVFLKYFCRSLLPLPHSAPPPTPLFLSFCHQAVIGCYDRAIAGLSAASKAQFNYSFSLMWHIHAQMHANSHTCRKVTHKHTCWHTNWCSAACRVVLAVQKNKKIAIVTELSVSHSTWQSRPPDVCQCWLSVSSAQLWKHHVGLWRAGRSWVWWAAINRPPCCARLWIAN